MTVELTVTNALLGGAVIAISILFSVVTWFIQRDFKARDERDTAFKNDVTELLKRVDGHGRTIIKIEGDQKVHHVRISRVENDVAQLRAAKEGAK